MVGNRNRDRQVKMVALEHEPCYEDLESAPPEHRPTTTKDFRAFKTLAVYSAYLVVRNRTRRLSHSLHSRARIQTKRFLKERS